MDINKTKLNRVIAHINDEGVINPTEIAKILRAQEKNTAFLRAYVVEACKEIGDQSALAEFDVALAGGEAPNPEPDALIEVDVALAGGKTSEPGPEKTNPPTQAEPSQTARAKQAFLRHEDGSLTPLAVLKESEFRIVFEVAKAKREVSIFLRGEVVKVDLLDLKPVTVKGVVFTVADLEVIANAADV